MPAFAGIFIPIKSIMPYKAIVFDYRDKIAKGYRRMHLFLKKSDCISVNTV
jgi:hypothetical protein